MTTTVEKSEIYKTISPVKKMKKSSLPLLEKIRQSRVNFNNYIELLSKGYTPTEARNKLGIRGAYRGYLDKRLSKVIKQYQSRKAEEITFMAELRHNTIYRSALEEFEKSKTDPKTGNQRPGNPIFLQIANECTKDIRKLLGLDKSNGDIVNNGNMAVFSWDSLHNRQGTLPQSLSNGQSITSSQEIARVDPVEERIRQLEQLAAQKKRENDEAIEEHGLPENDHKDSEPVEVIQRKIVLKAVKPVKQEIGHKECAVLQSSVSLDDLIG